jgi:hypothetical protein
MMQLRVIAYNHRRGSTRAVQGGPRTAPGGCPTPHRVWQHAHRRGNPRREGPDGSEILADC